MVEIRVAVEDGAAVHGLMRRLAALFGRSAISFDGSRNEVCVDSEWESRAVVEVFEAIGAWIEEEGGRPARLSIGKHSYLVEGRDSLRAVR